MKKKIDSPQEATALDCFRIRILGKFKAILEKILGNGTVDHVGSFFNAGAVLAAQSL
jgi:hypothetical protein